MLKRDLRREILVDAPTTSAHAVISLGAVQCATSALRLSQKARVNEENTAKFATNLKKLRSEPLGLSRPRNCSIMTWFKPFPET